MQNKQKISYCIWFNHNIEEALDYYNSIFPKMKEENLTHSPVDTPSGKAGSLLTATLEISGQEFVFLNGGPEFKPNPSISFFINCETEQEVVQLWNKLSPGGKTMMPLDTYPFSDKYGWIEDRFGLSWQIMLSKKATPQKLMPCLMFVHPVYGKASEAIHYYTSIFHNSKTGTLVPRSEATEGEKEGTLMFADFQLEHQWFTAMESGREYDFHFNEGVSFMVFCDSQEEIDYYWEKLTAGGQEVQCGWLRDKYGVAWQIVPRRMIQLLEGKDKDKARRAMEAMMKMVKFNIKELENA